MRCFRKPGLRVRLRPYGLPGRRECMPQTVRGNRLGNAANAMGLLTRIFNGACRDGFTRNVSRKQPRPGLLCAPPYAQDVQKLWGQHHVTILCAPCPDQRGEPSVDYQCALVSGEPPRRSAILPHKQLVRIVRCLICSTHVRKWIASSGLRTIGRVCGFFGAGMMSSKTQSLWSVTRYRKRRAQTAIRIEPGANFFSFVR